MTSPTHPLRNVCPALLSDEFQDTSVRMLSLLPVDQLHQEWPLYVEFGHLVESRGRKDNLGTIVELWSFGTRGHDDGIASIVLVKSLYDGSTSMASHVVEVLGISGIIPTTKTERLLILMLAHATCAGLPAGNKPW